MITERQAKRRGGVLGMGLQLRQLLRPGTFQAHQKDPRVGQGKKQADGQQQLLEQ